jgi:hypothetical protein
MTPHAKYREELVNRYWAYQRSAFPDAERYLTRQYAPDRRPPVFTSQEAWRNIIIDPGASSLEQDRLLALIPERDRHRWFASMNSSQALAQTVLGNLATYGHMSRLAELESDEGESLCGRAGISPNSFSMEVKIDHLHEPRPTSLDGYLAGDYRVAIECKFTETDVGACSRPRLTPNDPRYGSQLCDGCYVAQGNRRERCPLTEIGVLYWRYVPRLFRWQSDTDLFPCPLNRNYQLLRNILAVGVGTDGAASPQGGHVLLIYDERNPAFQEKGNGLAAYVDTRVALEEPKLLRKCRLKLVLPVG